MKFLVYFLSIVFVSLLTVLFQIEKAPIIIVMPIGLILGFFINLLRK